ncbi:hypothetical protein HY387_00235 [Candidatus Daviesbacteria bacterium]|nr:hypothetical protein [Candidatus Daviesbacteria bacterium]
MTNQEFDPYPKPLTPEERRGMESFLNTHRRLADRGAFTESGLFTTGNGVNYLCLWASNLLRFNPSENYIRIRTEGMIEVCLKHGPCRFVIDPANCRVVLREAYVPVFNSGRLFQTAHFSRDEVYRNLEGQELEDIVEGAESGQRPPFLSTEAFYRVPKPYADRELMLIEFLSAGLPDDYDRRDIVVLERVNMGYQLVPRLVEYPLHPDHWKG